MVHWFRNISEPRGERDEERRRGDGRVKDIIENEGETNERRMGNDVRVRGKEKLMCRFEK